jgi:hypothetical protein
MIYLQQVEAVHGGDLNTREVAECLGNAVVVAIDDQRALAQDIAAVAHLACGQQPKSM